MTKDEILDKNEEKKERGEEQQNDINKELRIEDPNCNSDYQKEEEEENICPEQ